MKLVCVLASTECGFCVRSACESKVGSRGVLDVTKQEQKSALTTGDGITRAEPASENKHGCGQSSFPSTLTAPCSELLLHFARPCVRLVPSLTWRRLGNNFILGNL